MDNENENDLIETNVSVSEQAKRDTDLPELTIESSSEDSMWEEILLKYAIKVNRSFDQISRFIFSFFVFILKLLLF